MTENESHSDEGLAAILSQTSIRYDKSVNPKYLPRKSAGSVKITLLKC